MKNAKTIALGMCMLTMVSGFTFTSCATKQGTGTLVGTGAGGALGALVGVCHGLHLGVLHLLGLLSHLVHVAANERSGSSADGGSYGSSDGGTFAMADKTANKSA